jgi:hypothetical protein
MPKPYKPVREYIEHGPEMTVSVFITIAVRRRSCLTGQAKN